MAFNLFNGFNNPFNTGTSLSTPDFSSTEDMQQQGYQKIFDESTGLHTTQKIAQAPQTIHRTDPSNGQPSATEGQQVSPPAPVAMEKSGDPTSDNMANLFGIQAPAEDRARSKTGLGAMADLMDPIWSLTSPKYNQMKRQAQSQQLTLQRQGIALQNDIQRAKINTIENKRKLEARQLFQTASTGDLNALSTLRIKYPDHYKAAMPSLVRTLQPYSHGLNDVATRLDAARTQQDVAAVVQHANRVNPQLGKVLSAIPAEQLKQNAPLIRELANSTREANVAQQKRTQQLQGFTPVTNKEGKVQTQEITTSSGALLNLPMATDAFGNQVLDPRVLQRKGVARADKTQIKELRDAYDAQWTENTKIASAYSRARNIVASGRSPTVQDVGLIYEFIKTIDPDSVVREGEVALTQSQRSYVNMLSGFRNRLADGGSLTQGEREQFLEAIMIYKDVADKKFDMSKEQLFRQGAMYNVRPESVFKGFGRSEKDQTIWGMAKTEADQEIQQIIESTSAPFTGPFSPNSSGPGAAVAPTTGAAAPTTPGAPPTDVQGAAAPMQPRQEDVRVQRTSAPSLRGPDGSYLADPTVTPAGQAPAGPLWDARGAEAQPDGGPLGVNDARGAELLLPNGTLPFYNARGAEAEIDPLRDPSRRPAAIWEGQTDAPQQTQAPAAGVQGFMGADASQGPAFDNYMSAMMTVESGGRNIKNLAGTSSADGYFQFTKGTWERVTGKPGPASKYSYEEQLAAAKKFTMENVNALRAAGITPTPTAMYATHFLGQGGGTRFMAAPDNEVATRHVSKGQAKANKSIFFKSSGKPRTVGEVKALFHNKMAKAAGVPSMPAPTETAMTAQAPSLFGARPSGKVDVDQNTATPTTFKQGGKPGDTSPSQTDQTMPIKMQDFSGAAPEGPRGQQPASTEARGPLDPDYYRTPEGQQQQEVVAGQVRAPEAAPGLPSPTLDQMSNWGPGDMSQMQGVQDAQQAVLKKRDDFQQLANAQGWDQADALGYGIANGLTLGWATEMGILDPKKEQILSDAYPGTVLLSDIGSGMLLGGAAGKAISSMTRGAGAMVRGGVHATAATAEGALSGAGYAPEGSKGEGATIGALLGAGFIGVGAAGESIIRKVAGRATPKVAGELAERAINGDQLALKQIKQLGVTDDELRAAKTAYDDFKADEAALQAASDVEHGDAATARASVERRLGQPVTDANPQMAGTQVSQSVEGVAEGHRATASAAYGEAYAKSPTPDVVNSGQLMDNIKAHLDDMEIVPLENTPGDPASMALRQVEAEANNLVMTMNNMNDPKVIKRFKQIKSNLRSAARTAAKSGDGAAKKAYTEVANALENEFKLGIERRINQGSLTIDEALDAVTALDKFGIADANFAEYKRLTTSTPQSKETQRMLANIATGKWTPEHVTNALLGKTLAGLPASAVDLVKEVKKVTSNDPKVIGALKSEMLSRVFMNTDGTPIEDALKVSKNMQMLLGGKGKDLSKELFSPDELTALRGTGQALSKMPKDAVRKAIAQAGLSGGVAMGATKIMGPFMGAEAASAMTGILPLSALRQVREMYEAGNPWRKTALGDLAASIDAARPKRALQRSMAAANPAAGAAAQLPGSGAPMSQEEREAFDKRFPPVF